MKRVFDPADPELMDLPQPVTDALATDLANLQSLNRWFGAHRILQKLFLPHLEDGGRYRVLDLCTGSGDLPRFLIDAVRRRGGELQVDAVDFQASTLAIAERQSSGYPEIRYIQADVCRPWSFATEPYDFVICSLALHHLTAAQAKQVLLQMRGAATVGALAADLMRSRLTSTGIWLLTTFWYRQPMTVADARKSAAAAFSAPELADLASDAGWRGFVHERWIRFGRQAIWLDLGPTHGR